MTPYAWTLPSGWVVRVHDPAEWSIFCEIYVDGEYDDAIRLALAAPRTDKNFYFLDLGANHGLFTLRLLDRLRSTLPTAHCHGLIVEAAQANCRLLKKNLAQIPPAIATLEIHHAAVGSREPFVELWHDGPSHTTHSLLASSGGAGRTCERVPTLDLAAPTSPWPRLDLVKIDIEGAEEALFENFAAVLEKTSVLCFELHTQQCHKEKISALLKAKGFVLHHTLGKVYASEQILTWVRKSPASQAPFPASCSPSSS